MFSSFPREETNLNKKEFWQIILVLVAKFPHHANDLLEEILSMMEHGDEDFFQLKELHMRLKMLHIYFSIFANIEHSTPPPQKKKFDIFRHSK